IGASDITDCSPEQIRAFGDGTADENAARAGTGTSESLRARVALLDKEFGAGYEVLPCIRLGSLVARLVPGFAVVTSASGLIISNDLPPQGNGMAHIEIRCVADYVGAVALQNAAIASVQRNALLVDDGEWDHGAIVPRHLNLFGD